MQDEDNEDADGNEVGDYEDYDCDGDDDTDRGALSNQIIDVLKFSYI